MALSAVQIAGSIERILTILGSKAREDLQAYVMSILEVCGSMEPFKFDEVCREIVRTWRNPWRPKPSEYLLVQNRLSKDRNWGFKAGGKCPSCEDTGYVAAWYMRVRDNSDPMP